MNCLQQRFSADQECRLKKFQTALSCLERKAGLFDILHLFAHLFDQDFQLDRGLGAFGSDGFAAQSVGFAVQFLHQEVQPFAAAAFVFGNDTAHFGNVGAQAAEFFVDVGFLDKEGKFLLQPVVVDAADGFGKAGADFSLCASTSAGKISLKASMISSMFLMRCNRCSPNFSLHADVRR